VPTRTQNTPLAPRIRSSVSFLRNFWQFLADQKIIKKTYFQKPPKISKIEPEVAQGLHLESFWMTFGIPLAINFLIFSQSAKPLFLNNSMVLSPHLPLPKRHLSALISHQNIMLFRDTLRDLTFPHFILLYVEKGCDFGTPSKSNGVQKGIRNPRSGAKKLQKSIRWRYHWQVLKPTAAQNFLKCPKASFLSTVVGFSDPQTRFLNNSMVL
jgi:hypothetical protein